MPTGYTHSVCEGKVTEFPVFAMSCARAFGALITMRDDPMDAPIPDEIKLETTYYDDRIAADRKRMGEVQAMTYAEADAAATAEHQEALASRAKYLAEKEQEAARINAMMAKVRAWQPPTPDHVGMKEFMIEQLTISLPGNYSPEITALLDGIAWRSKEIERLSQSVAYARGEREKEIERARSRTEWVNALRGSLVPRHNRLGGE